MLAGSLDLIQTARSVCFHVPISYVLSMSPSWWFYYVWKAERVFHCGNMQSSEFILLNRNWIASVKPAMNNNLVLYDARHVYYYLLRLWIPRIPKVFLVFKFRFEPSVCVSFCIACARTISVIHTFHNSWIFWCLCLMHLCICCIFSRFCLFFAQTLGARIKLLWLQCTLHNRSQDQLCWVFFFQMKIPNFWFLNLTKLWSLVFRRENLFWAFERFFKTS